MKLFNSFSVIALASALIAAPLASADSGAKETETLPPDVLLTWDSQSISTLDFNAALLKVREGDRPEFLRQMKRITALLDQIMMHRALASEAKAAGMDQTPLHKKRVALIEEEVLSRERQLAIRKAVVVPDMTIPAKEQYLLNKASYMVKAQVRAGHVLITTKDRTEAEALERANKVRSMLMAGGKLNELAAEYSEDPSAKSNVGDLGFFTRGKMIKEFEDAAFQLAKPGDVSDVVKTQFGYHVIQLIGKKDERQRDFDEVKEAIIAGLDSDYRDRQLEAHIQKIRNNHSIKLNAQAIDALQTLMKPQGK